MDTLNKERGEIPFSFFPKKSKNQITKSTIKRKPAQSTIKKLSETTKSTIKRKPARTSERIPVDILQNNMI